MSSGELWRTLLPNFPGFDTYLEPLPHWHGEGSTDVLRLDQLHPLISGNKLFKLIGHLSVLDGVTCAQRGSLVSFGGVWSNHLHALAAVGQALDIKVHGMVRGFVDQPLTATLNDCQRMGMVLHFCDRATYARRYDSVWHKELAETWQAMVIAEGGDGAEGEIGFELLQPVLQEYDEVWLAAGTGTTARGIALWMRSDATLVAVNAVSDHGALRRRWVSQEWPVMWRLLDEYHEGRFARCSESLCALIREYDVLNLPLDPVYTVKLVNALRQEEIAGRLPSVKRLLIHSGGLQGRRGYPQISDSH